MGKNLFWGFTGLGFGIVLTVAATILRNMRPLLWIAFPVFFVPITQLIWWIVRSWPKRVFVLVLTLLIVFFATRWLYSYVPAEVSKPMEATVSSGGSMGLHSLLTAGACQGGTPEVGQNRQWTWFLNGSLFDCESNEYKSPATIRFEPGAIESVDTHAEEILYRGGPVGAQISWYATRGDGKVMWVLSAACADSRILSSLDYKDVLTILDPPEKAGLRFQKTSEGTFPVPGNCTYPGGLFLRLARHGEEKEDTLPAPAYLTGLQIDSAEPANALGN